MRLLDHDYGVVVGETIVTFYTVGCRGLKAPPPVHNSIGQARRWSAATCGLEQVPGERVGP